MGGQAFSSGDNPLYTPRMPPNVYQHVLEQCHAKLRELFVIVASPIPGPAKPDYGDVDIFLAWERNSVFPLHHADGISKKPPSSRHDTLTASAQLLNAERYVQDQPGVMITAIPWPCGLLRTMEDDEDIDDDVTPRYIQVDLHFCDSLDRLQWMLGMYKIISRQPLSIQLFERPPSFYNQIANVIKFKHAHGDLWNLLGSTIRPYGLTVDEFGLYVRIPEIETLDKKKARVLLSTSPTEILNFLGLKYDGTQWEEPFTSDEDLFEYATTCQFFWVRPEPDDKHVPTDSGEVDRSKLKANDRRRMNTRPVFRKWVDEFLPACRETGRFTTQYATRDSVCAEAFKCFPGAQHTYEAQLIEWKKERQRQTLWRSVIKASIPEVPDGEEETSYDKCWRGRVAGAFKKIIMQNDYSLGIHPSTSLCDATGFYDEEKVKQFVVDEWEQVSDVIRLSSQK
ncbi:hypothetical protein F4781DRAFT_133543 [Annulohypoxylon bovei var. microspora]|nr:hypothetical protein F4781DRAFT_133543 [Annulohypoxylon bovei var. microspora]